MPLLGGSASDSLLIEFGGIQLLDLHDAPYGDYTQTRYETFVTSASALLSFQAANARGTWALDDVSVIDIAPIGDPVREPARKFHATQRVYLK